MYLSQRLHVQLTDENAAILTRPSKIFNKIGALLSGKMTPTEIKQAEVMLSVIQRLNIAFRKAGYTNLVSISVNGQSLYDDKQNSDNDLELSNTHLTTGLESGDFRKINYLSISVEGEDAVLRYLIHVNIARRPKKDRTPVQITVFGFLKEFKQHALETDDQFSIRIKATLAKHWGEDLPAKLAAIEADFNTAVDSIQRQIDALFPSKSSLDDSKYMLRITPLSFGNKAIQSRYDDFISYLPLFYLHFEQQDNQDATPVDFELDESGDWALDSADFDSSDKSSWTDSISLGDSGFSDPGSTCSGGAGCGGGCGGS